MAELGGARLGVAGRNNLMSSICLKSHAYVSMPESWKSGCIAGVGLSSVAPSDESRFAFDNLSGIGSCQMQLAGSQSKTAMTRAYADSVPNDLCRQRQLADRTTDREELRRLIFIGDQVPREKLHLQNLVPSTSREYVSGIGNVTTR